MNNLKWAIGYLCIFLCSNQAYSQSQQVVLTGTQVLKFQSKIDSEQYVLDIRLPDNYTKTNKKYPVLYVTDAQWAFSSMYVGYRGQHGDGLVPDLIIVGITWTDSYDTRRERDFTPTTRIDEDPNTGNAPKFLSVIKNEIIHLIDSNYRTEKNDRALFGASLGGLFTVYTLFHEPALFNRYIIISPALWWDDEIVFKYEKDFAKKNSSLNAKVFISSGEHEEKIDVGNRFNRFTNQLKARNYKGLEIESMVIDRMGHLGSGTMGAILGLQSVYSKKKDFMPDTFLLEKYKGLYALDKDTTLITQKGNFIYCQLSHAGTVYGEAILHAEASDTFYIKGLSGLLKFKRNEKNMTIGYDFINNDTTVFFKRLR